MPRFNSEEFLSPGFKRELTVRLWPNTTNYGITGLHCEVFFGEMTKGEHKHDCYIYMEDDIGITPGLVRSLARANTALADDFEHIVSPQRFEIRNNSRFLIDHFTPPEISAVTRIKDISYIIPHNPYAAMYFMPRVKLHFAMCKYAIERKVRWGVDANAIKAEAWREDNAGLWFINIFAAAIPLNDFENFLVHHRSSKYVISPNWEVPTVESFIAAALCYKGEPLDVRTDMAPTKSATTDRFLPPNA